MTRATLEPRNCIDIARDARQRLERGESLTAIRRAVEEEYVPRYGAGTPTPPPPLKGDRK